jgi:hypothetical protein
MNNKAMGALQSWRAYCKPKIIDTEEKFDGY